MSKKDPKELRIVYMGTPDFAVAPLKALVENGYNVVAVVTMPDKPARRGLKLQESAVKRYAVSVGLPVLQPEKLKSEEFVAQFRALNPDLGIVVAFRMLPEVIFAAPRFGTFNLHASLLPQYRGAAPINWAIINGDAYSGVTTFLLNSRMDEGAIIDAERVDIATSDNVGILHDKLMEIGAGLVLKSVDKLVSDGFRPQPQPAVSAEELKPAPKIFKETCHIDFNAAGKDIINLIRGLSPYPAAWTTLHEIADNGDVHKEIPVKIFESSFEPHGISCAGRVGEVSIENNIIRIACHDGYIIPTQIQPAGKQRMSVKDFINGLKVREGVFAK